MEYFILDFVGKCNQHQLVTPLMSGFHAGLMLALMMDRCLFVDFPFFNKYFEHELDFSWKRHAKRLLAHGHNATASGNMAERIPFGYVTIADVWMFKNMTAYFDKHYGIEMWKDLDWSAALLVNNPHHQVRKPNHPARVYLYWLLLCYCSFLPRYHSSINCLSGSLPHNIALCRVTDQICWLVFHANIANNPCTYERSISQRSPGKVQVFYMVLIGMAAGLLTCQFSAQGFIETYFPTRDIFAPLASFILRIKPKYDKKIKDFKHKNFKLFNIGMQVRTPSSSYTCSVLTAPPWTSNAAPLPMAQTTACACQFF